MTYTVERPTYHPAGHAKACINTTSEYLNGDISSSSAVRRLDRKGSLGRLLSGEILVEEASRSKPSMASTWIAYARGYLSNSMRITDESVEDHISSYLQAASLLTQLPLLEVVLKDNNLPNKRMLEPSYKSYVKHAARVVDYLDINPNDRYPNLLKTRSIIGRVAVDLLAKRYALREIGCESWLPLQSSLSERFVDGSLDSGRTGWDLNIFTKLSNQDPVDRTYKVRVDQKPRPYYNSTEEGISRINIVPDLSLYPGDKNVNQKIIQGCYLEMHKKSGLERITKNLDDRTEQLLDRIDQVVL